MTVQIRREDQMLGRFVLAETKHLIASGILRETDWACPEGSQLWVRLGSLLASQEPPEEGPQPEPQEISREVRPSSPVWRFFKKLVLFSFLLLVTFVVLVVGAYFYYPYYTVNSLQKAMKKGDIQQVERHVDVSAVNRSLSDQLPRRLEAQAMEASLNDYAANLVNAAFLKQCLSETLGTDTLSKWIALFRGGGKLEAGPTGGMTAGGSPRHGACLIKSLQCQGVTRGFSKTPLTFRVNFEAATLEVEAWNLEYSSVSTLPLQFKIPRGALVFALDGIRWRLKQIDLPEKVTVLAQVVRMSAADLDGSWNSEEGGINLDFRAEDQRIVEANGEMAGGFGLENIPIQSVQIQGNTAHFSWRSRAYSGQAMIEKSPGHPLKLHWQPTGSDAISTPLARNSTKITESELAGLWQAEGTQVTSLDLELADDQTLHGTVEYRANNRTLVGNLDDVVMLGRRAKLVWSGPDVNETLIISKQREGNYFLLEAGGDAASAKTGLLRKAGEPLPAWKLEELEGQWESDIHRLVEIKVSGNQISRCNFVSRRTPQLKFEVLKTEVYANSIMIRWQSTVAAGEAIVKKRRDRQFWIYWEVQAARPGVLAPPPVDRYGRSRRLGPPPGVASPIQVTGEWYPLREYQAPAKIELYTLQVESNLPSQVSPRLTVSPLDRSGLYDGTPPFTRTYTNGTVVSVAAPQSVAGANFLRWEGADFPNDLSVRFSLTNNRTLKLIYQTVETTPQASSWTGTWLVDERESVELKQTGDQVTGKYDRGRGTITGVVKTGTAGETVDGTWKSGASTGTVTILSKPNGDIELRFFFNKELLYKKFGKKTSP